MLDLIEELKLFEEGYASVGGIDEAGRGPLAGPVVAACAVLSRENSEKFEKNKFLKKYIDDSKKITSKRRDRLYDIIMEEFDEVGIGICDSATIDRINILQATFLAMKKALSSLKAKPHFILLDGNFPLPNISIGQMPVIGGDSQVFSIAAASIIAKVTRDRIMCDYHGKFSNYGFDKHKGYGTKLHKERLREYGPCEIHRRSFGPVKTLIKN